MIRQVVNLCHSEFNGPCMWLGDLEDVVVHVDFVLEANGVGSWVYF